MQFLLFAVFTVCMYSYGISHQILVEAGAVFLGMAVVLICVICLSMAYNK